MSMVPTRQYLNINMLILSSGWNKQWNTNVGVSHASFWVFLGHLQQEQRITEQKIQRAVQGRQLFAQ